MSVNTPPLPQIAIIGMEGSGKTVLTTVLAKRLSTMADQGMFLNPKSSKTIKYVEGVWKELQDGKWPPSTPPGELFDLEWLFHVDNKHECPVRLVDAAGQDMRMLFADDRYKDQSLPAQLQQLVDYCHNSNILIILINLKDFIGESDDMRRVENQAALKSALDLLASKDDSKRVAFVFSQCDQYEATIEQHGSLENLLRTEMPYIYGAHYKGKAPALFPVAAVAETKVEVDLNGTPRRVPTADFKSTGLEPLIEWMSVQIAGQAKKIMAERDRAEREQEKRERNRRTWAAREQAAYAGQEFLNKCWSLVQSEGSIALVLLLLLYFTGWYEGIYENFIDRNKPDLPLKISWRDSFMPGGGKVATFHNSGNTPLEITVVIKNHNSGTGRSTSSTVPANGKSSELGWLELENWVIEKGETVTAKHPDYKRATWTVP